MAILGVDVGGTFTDAVLLDVFMIVLTGAITIGIWWLMHGRRRR